MWRSSSFRAFARWGLCQHYRPKAKPTKEDRLLTPTSTFGTQHDGHSNYEKETSNDNRYFARKPDFSFLETVGWVGTVLTVGLNLNLHSKQTRNNEVATPTKGSCSSPSASSFSICSLLQNFLLKFALASPLNGLSSSKSVLPDEPKQTLQTERKDTSIEAKDNLSLKPGEELEQITREYFGQLENLTGTELYPSNATSAVEHFERATALGASSAHYNLGVCYENGTGVAADEARAAYHYREAALDGHGLATYNLGIFYLDGRGGLRQDPEKAVKLIKKASVLGVPQAKTYMGQHYFHQSAWEKALPLFREAAKKKDADASYFLGYCYEKGLGVGRDLQAAAQHYRDAASAGDEVAAAALKELPQNFEPETPSSVPESAEPEEHSYYTTTTSTSPPKEPAQLHHSSSSPELSRWGSSQPPAKHNVPISQYLNLMLPNIISYPRSKFVAGDDLDPAPESITACHEVCAAV
uniref:Putative death ligand signal enhancer n=1 Tax=Ornithodoros turicata TaxID=34597 RepID=A0A2R5L5Z4_9ACAR